MSHDTSKTSALQALHARRVLRPFATRLLLASALALTLCLAVLVVHAEAVTPWLPAVTHLASPLMRIPHPWGCGGTSTAC
jgi:hypothetical protein